MYHVHKIFLTGVVVEAIKIALQLPDCVSDAVTMAHKQWLRHPIMTALKDAIQARATWCGKGLSGRGFPISDIAFAGGWSDATTLVRCYQRPDEATLLRVMSEPRRVVEGAVGV
jgi:hypothetical protein